MVLRGRDGTLVRTIEVFDYRVERSDGEMLAFEAAEYQPAFTPPLQQFSERTIARLEKEAGPGGIIVQDGARWARTTDMTVIDRTDSFFYQDSDTYVLLDNEPPWLDDLTVNCDILGDRAVQSWFGFSLYQNPTPVVHTFRLDSRVGKDSLPALHTYDPPLVTSSADGDWREAGAAQCPPELDFDEPVDAFQVVCVAPGLPADFIHRFPLSDVASVERIYVQLTAAPRSVNYKGTTEVQFGGTEEPILALGMFGPALVAYLVGGPRIGLNWADLAMPGANDTFVIDHHPYSDDAEILRLDAADGRLRRQFVLSEGVVVEDAGQPEPWEAAAVDPEIGEPDTLLLAGAALRFWLGLGRPWKDLLTLHTFVLPEQFQWDAWLDASTGPRA